MQEKLSNATLEGEIIANKSNFDVELYELSKLYEKATTIEEREQIKSHIMPIVAIYQKLNFTFPQVMVASYMHGRGRTIYESESQYKHRKLDELSSIETMSKLQNNLHKISIRLTEILKHTNDETVKKYLEKILDEITIYTSIFLEGIGEFNVLDPETYSAIKVYLGKFEYNLKNKFESRYYEITEKLGHLEVGEENLYDKLTQEQSILASLIESRPSIRDFDLNQYDAIHNVNKIMVSTKNPIIYIANMLILRFIKRKLSLYQQNINKALYAIKELNIQNFGSIKSLLVLLYNNIDESYKRMTQIQKYYWSAAEHMVTYVFKKSYTSEKEFLDELERTLISEQFNEELEYKDIFSEQQKLASRYTTFQSILKARAALERRTRAKKESERRKLARVSLEPEQNKKFWEEEMKRIRKKVDESEKERQREYEESIYFPEEEGEVEEPRRGFTEEELRLASRKMSERKQSPKQPEQQRKSRGRPKKEN